MKTGLRWIAGAAVAIAGFAAIPAQARTDVAIGVSLGGPAYYEPAPRYYQREVIYEEPVRYYEPRVVYEREYCPPRRYYHGHYVDERVYYRSHRHHGRYWD
ncbi:MAG TPA: hypothetical protein VFB36_03855 [Nevskiaceae bacterium]|nr:hypothetical protein [Nevskiaceae bacterium]